ncbi:MAG: serine/threonine protein phosphatase [Alphaproteobacteria bacterium]|nr:MAG: serine/threonine protein phosphatase [Alphaproteobacteria bacterium]
MANTAITMVSTKVITASRHMLRNLANAFLPRRPEGRRIAASIPAGQRVYAIGDIHGRSDLLAEMLELIKADAQNYKGQVTFVGIGDYIDRGPDSKGCVDLLTGEFIPASWKRVYLRGNHEQAMLDFLGTASLGERGGARCEWLVWGGLQALDSYGVAPYGAHGMRDIGALAAEFENALSETAHATFYQNTQLSFVCGGYLFVHAGVRQGIPANKQMPEDLLFIREDFLGRPHGLPYRVVFGHTILENPLVEDDRIGLDTGAFQSGVLSAVRLEGVDLKIIQTC